MKKPQLSPLVLVTCVCAAFTLGFFLGRNQNHTEVMVSAMQTTATSTTQETTTAPETSPATGGPTETEEAPSTVETAPAEASGLININTATQAELMTLPGIGEVIAQRIIDYRTTHGNFRTPEDLLNVSGIGEKRLEAIIDYITVGG